MTAPSQAIAPIPHTNLLNVYIQIANKLEFQKKYKIQQLQTLLIGQLYM
jgi:hypothetical protein